MSIPKPFLDYIALTGQIKKLEEKKESLKWKVLKAMDDENANHLETPFGVFFNMDRKTWVYSDTISNRAKALAQSKKIEEKNGTAYIDKTTRYVVFKPKK